MAQPHLTIIVFFIWGGRWYNFCHDSRSCLVAQPHLTIIVFLYEAEVGLIFITIVEVV